MKISATEARCSSSIYIPIDAKVSLAIGADWSDNGKYLRLCMHNADEAMYADKNNFYEEHPEVPRR